MPALVAREQQQRADQVGALLLGALDAAQARLHALVEFGTRQQQLGRAADHRQRRAQFVADVGVELAVALHHFGQARGVIVERGGELADFVVREMRRPATPARCCAPEPFRRLASSDTGLMTREAAHQPTSNDSNVNTTTAP